MSVRSRTKWLWARISLLSLEDLNREGQQQRFLRKIEDKGLFDDNTYKKIYSSGSNPVTTYGLPKTHKFVS